MVLLGVEPLWEGRVFRQSAGLQPDPLKYGPVSYAAVELSGELFPLANTKSTFLRGFGVTLNFARAFAFQTDSGQFAAFADRNIPPAETSFMRYAAGLRYRIHANPSSETPLVVGISASLRRWYLTFATDLPSGAELEVPSADYRMGRFGFDGALEVKRFTFYAAAYYLHAFSVTAPNTRELDTTTPYLASAPGMGGEFRGSAGVRLARWVELRLSLEYAVMAYHLESLQQGGQPDRVLDSYLSVGLGPYVNF
jgi:hypothetical protein